MTGTAETATPLSALRWEKDTSLEDFMDQFVDRKILTSAEFLPWLLSSGNMTRTLTPTYLYHNGDQTVLVDNFGLFDLEDDDNPGVHDPRGELVFYFGNGDRYLHSVDLSTPNSSTRACSSDALTRDAKEKAVRVKVGRLRLNEHKCLTLNYQSDLNGPQQTLADAVCNWSSVRSMSNKGNNSVRICFSLDKVNARAGPVDVLCSYLLNSYHNGRYNITIKIRQDDGLFNRSVRLNPLWAVGQKAEKMMVPPDVADALRNGRPFTYHDVTYTAQRDK